MCSPSLITNAINHFFLLENPLPLTDFDSLYKALDDQQDLYPLKT